MGKISGPIMDRIDIHIEVPSVKYRDLADNSDDSDTSHVIRSRVNQARKIQKQRYGKFKGIHSNSHLQPQRIKEFCGIDSDGERILQRAIDSFGFSARAYHRILKVARTIADLEGETSIQARHLSEAVQYRTLDRNLWMQ